MSGFIQELVASLSVLRLTFGKYNIPPPDTIVWGLGADWRRARRELARELDALNFVPHGPSEFANLSAYGFKLRADAAPAASELASALNAMVDHEVEFMILNQLGDPERQHNIKRARKALAEYKGETA